VEAWGPELRMAGYDGLWISPIFISIIDQEFEIHNAVQL
jgi:hypothetical protein